nr:putative rubredoxin-like non-heme iron protein [uncultured bacterium]
MVIEPKKIRQPTFFKEVMLCQAGNAQIAGTPLKTMPTPMRVHHAKKNVNFSIIPATPRIVLTKVRMTESGNRKPDFSVEQN